MDNPFRRVRLCVLDAICAHPVSLGFVCGVLTFSFITVLITAVLSYIPFSIDLVHETLCYSQDDGIVTEISRSYKKADEILAVTDLPAPEDISEDAEEVVEEGNDAIAEDDGAYEEGYEEESEYEEPYGSWDSTLPNGAHVFNLYVSSYAQESQWAVNQGGIVRWLPGYYAAHNYSGGSVFFDMQPGDIVYIDGMEVSICGSMYADYNCNYIEDVWNQVGWDKICFQTCLSDYGSGVMVVYGVAL